MFDETKDKLKLCERIETLSESQIERFKKQFPEARIKLLLNQFFFYAGDDKWTKEDEEIKMWILTEHYGLQEAKSIIRNIKHNTRK